MDSLLVAFAIGLVVWLLMRRAVYARARRQMAQREASGQAPPPSGDARSMPRLGTPGTVTRDQVARLRERSFEPSRDWSHEEAQLILDTVTYLRAVIREETDDDDPPIEIQNKVLGFILTDETMREATQDWAINLTREDEESGRFDLPHDETYERVADFIEDLWEDSTGGV